MPVVLLQPDGVAISAGDHRRGRAALYGGGGGRRVGGRSGFRVDTPPNVLIVSVTGWSLAPCAAMIDPGASTNQGMYGWATDSTVTGTPTPQDATLPRKDIYYIQVNDSSSGDGSGEISANVKYLAGTPNASPVAPTLPPRSLLIATVTVPQVGGGSPVVVLNPARFVAAGAPLPINSQAEEDALEKYVGLEIIRTDQAGLPKFTCDGTKFLRKDPKTWRFERTIATDSNPGDIAGTTSLMPGTITDAPAGLYLIEGRTTLYSSALVRGYAYVKAGSVVEEARYDFTGDSNPRPMPVQFIHTHTGGNLAIEVGYRVIAGQPIVTGKASGLTRITATLLGN